jgi:GntR family transcriptional regulator, transcriptional repressor for pyruvate dehydrogenase complex
VVGYLTDSDRAGIQPVRRLKVSDSVAAQLEQLILRGSYRVGDRLPPERELAEQFGVGRSSMREALRRIETHGLITIDHGRGTFVAADVRRAGQNGILLIDGFTVPELIDVRLSLEGDAASLAARRIVAKEKVALTEVVTAADDLSLSDDEFIQLDWQIHRQIAAATKNTLLLRLTDSLEGLFDMYSHRVIQLPDRRALAQKGHREIVAAVVNNQARAARNAATRHIHEVERDIAAHLTRLKEAREPDGPKR